MSDNPTNGDPDNVREKTPKARSAARSPQKGGLDDKRVSLGIRVMSAVTIIVLIWMVAFRLLFGSEAISPEGRGFAAVVVGCLAGLVFFFVIPRGTTAAVFGEVWGVKLHVTGAGGLGLATCVLFLLFTPATTQTIDVSLWTPSDALIQQNFDLSYYHPATGPQNAPGVKGYASVRLPAGTKKLDVSAIGCPGFQLRDKAPFDIVDGQVKLVVVPVIQPPERSPPLPKRRSSQLAQRRGRVKGPSLQGRSSDPPLPEQHRG